MKCLACLKNKWLRLDSGVAGEAREQEGLERDGPVILS